MLVICSLIVKAIFLVKFFVDCNNTKKNNKFFELDFYINLLKHNNARRVDDAPSKVAEIYFDKFTLILVIKVIFTSIARVSNWGADIP